MGTKKWREQTIADLSRHGVSLHLIRKLLRYGATLHRLAEAQCNGDWPADNGERTVVPCTRCESLWVRSSMVADKTKGYAPGTLTYYPLICKDCRTEELIHATCKEAGLTPVINGDPRGAVLCVKFPGQTEQDHGIFVA